MDLLGNPLNLFMGLGTGVVAFFRNTQAEMVGDADSRGEGLRKLAKAVIGGPFASLSKMTGSIAGLIEEVTGLKPGAGGAAAAAGWEDELGQSFSVAAAAAGSFSGAARVGGASGGAQLQQQPQQRPQHLGDGLLKGGEHFFRTMRTGVRNMYDLPATGATRDGFAGFIKGMGKGVVGALAAPVVATLGGISRVTDTVRGLLVGWLVGAFCVLIARLLPQPTFALNEMKDTHDRRTLSLSLLLSLSPSLSLSFSLSLWTDVLLRRTPGAQASS
jgi:vacuolar protein sorting-associated protein 13A/C